MGVKIQFKFKKAEWSESKEGFSISLFVEGGKSELKKFCEGMAGMDYVAEIKRYFPKRTLTQNAYMWELIGQLAETHNLPSVEIYRNAIRAVGVYQDMAIHKNAVRTIRAVWGKMGIGWFSELVDSAGREFKIIRGYYGSSVYNTKQMARLIDYVVQDCHASGIEP